MKLKYHEDFLAETVIFYKSIVEQLRKFKLSQNKVGISHYQIVPYATYSPWHDDDVFMKCYTAIKNNTLVDIYRCYELWKFVLNTNHLDGDILEVGVWRGGTGSLLALAAQISSSSTVYLADTFTGVVKASEKDPLYKGGEHSDTTEAIVIELLAAVETPNYKLLKGIFPDQVRLPDADKVKLRFCHIDVDTYESAREIFNYAWPRVIPGGIIVFDDYGFWSCEGVTDLCNSLKPLDGTFIHNLNGHGIFVKH